MSNTNGNRVASMTPPEYPPALSVWRMLRASAQADAANVDALATAINSGGHVSWHLGRLGAKALRGEIRLDTALGLATRLHECDTEPEMRCMEWILEAIGVAEQELLELAELQCTTGITGLALMDALAIETRYGAHEACTLLRMCRVVLEADHGADRGELATG
jgi:hypothetical protein